MIVALCAASTPSMSKVGEQRLVGRDHVLAVVDRAQHEFARDAGAADHFRDDRDRRIVDDRVEVIGQRHAAGFAAERRVRLGRVAHGNACNLDATTRATFDFFLIAAQYREGAAAYRAEAQQSNFDWFHAACVSSRGLKRGRGWHERRASCATSRATSYARPAQAV
jgi:hypothetical protein